MRQVTHEYERGALLQVKLTLTAVLSLISEPPVMVALAPYTTPSPPPPCEVACAGKGAKWLEHLLAESEF